MCLKEKPDDKVVVHPPVVEGTAEALPVTVRIEKKLPYIVIIIGIITIIIASALALRFTFGAEVVYWFLGIVEIIIGLMALEPRYRERMR
jgi:uncharacterized membrane protein HdeD (DUF308 family)